MFYARIFLISAESFFVTLHGAITSMVFFCIFGGMLSFVFSYGMISFGLDFIQISLSSRIRIFIPIYSAAVLAFAISIIFTNAIEHPSFILNILGIWIPATVSVILGQERLKKHLRVYPISLKAKKSSRFPNIF